ncbi:DHA1 family tetracycline resistance protein-like MFS transporter [Litorimonas taeanensis]|uniref:DHA1 family tetracycline resistance protein-like MFS transporter n=1 Tax=Litorimonas taeanensis TaxID=568099 RepID=A0A420WJ38_9PROT|nr:TCR/Tet family MFS transporter [Litorimonas taeanensis]RKQ71017.1 DHA1 family tetracycline resistance protein-like MFS transporter [Litorimonas taeanensis]
MISLKTKTKQSKNAMVFVLITVMINSIGFGILIPVLPDLLKTLTDLPNNQAALYGMWLTFVFALFQFICMPIIGGLSDRYGRRPIMLLSLFGLGIDYFIMGLAPTVAFLFIGRIIAGAMGATFSTANAYIADISPPETRAQNFGLVGASFGVGFMLGPVIGGLIGESFGPRAPFIAAGVLSLMNVAYGYIFLPETLPADKRRDFSWKRSNPFGSLKSLGQIKGVKGLIFILFLLAMAHTVYPTTYAFSTIEGLGWNKADVGFSLGVFGIASMVVQGGLIRIIIPKVGLFWAGVIGIISAIIAYTMMGSADSGWVIYAAGPFAALAGLYGPALTNMMSSRVSASEQGELQGAIGAAQGLALMIGPFAMSGMFWYFGDTENKLPYGLVGFPDNLIHMAQHAFAHGPAPYVPGAPFLTAAALSLLGFGLFVLVTTKADRQARYYDVDEAK